MATAASSFTESQFSASLQLYGQKDYKGARDILRQLTSAQPKNALYWFNYGNACFMLKDFVTAEKAFATVENLQSPLAPAATLYRAKALREAGQTEQAILLLQDLVKRENLPTHLKEQAGAELAALRPAVGEDSARAQIVGLYRNGRYKRALQLIKNSRDPDLLMLKALILIKLNEEEAAYPILRQLNAHPNVESYKNLSDQLIGQILNTYSKPKWFFVDAALGHDSNIRLARNSEAGTRLFADVGGGGRVWSENLDMVTLGYTGRIRETAGQKDLRVVSHEVQTGVGRELGTELYMLSPFFILESWADTPVRWSLGTRLRLRKGTESFEYGLTAELSSDRAMKESLAYLSGVNLQTRVFAGWIRYPSYIQAFLTFETQNTGGQPYSDGETVPTAYLGWGPGARYLYRFNRRWAFEISALYVGRHYRGLVLPNEQERRDEELLVGTTVTRLFSNRHSIYLTVSSDRNKSTLSANDSVDQTYNQWQVLTGAVWEAF